MGMLKHFQSSQSFEQGDSESHQGTSVGPSLGMALTLRWAPLLHCGIFLHPITFEKQR